jgi:uncharacterized protein with ParB-like and HNH nuclease domain/predicted transport protein
MKATEAKLLDFLRRSNQFVVPIYQRTYSWTKVECKQLWDDIVKAGDDDNVTVHFIGSIVYIEQGVSNVVSPSQLQVIDGQQRLTTVMLLMAALANALGDSEPVAGFRADKLRNYYLLNPLEDHDRRYKLLLSQTDKASLIALVDSREQPRDPSVRVTKNFAFFEYWIDLLKPNLTAICKGLAKLGVVDIALNRGQDNPQLIFESMNSTGRELSQADLIRNFVLMDLEGADQTRLYELYWRPMELEFGQEAYSSQFDSFMRHYLTVETGEIPTINGVYEAFKKHARPVTKKAGVEALVKEIHRFSRYFCAMALGTETNPDLKSAFHDLGELKVDVAYPFLMELYQDYETGKLSAADFISAVRLVESYVFRRYICALPTHSMNKTFATFKKALNKDRYLESIQAHFLGMSSYRRFPDDKTFSRDLPTRDVYTGNARRGYWLFRLETFGQKEPLNKEYTVNIEHILPQNPVLCKEWKSDLGPDWERIQNTWLHTIGNLTLTGYNSPYSDKPFSEKRDMERGFKESPLRLNAGLRLLDVWNEEAIKARAAQLTEKALQVWTAPKLSPEIAASYRPKADPEAYGLKDHPSISSGPLAEVFEAFRKEVLALDPCVTETFLKNNVVAYKAENNFVDLVPQAKRVKLTLNMKLADLEDPNHLCKDVSGVGHSGYGDVQLILNSTNELPDIMGLVRQSFDKQMGDGDV